MALNGIDIASYQAGLDLAAVPCDFVIVKATQGTSYVNPYCSGWVESALALGKCVGIYHYIAGGNPISEAEYFYRNCSTWNGLVVWCLDWESGGNSAWGCTDYLERCAQRLAELTGRPPIIYASASAYPWDVARANNCGAWVAQYANDKPTGYQSSPWNEGVYSCAIRQYTSAGTLPGWGGRLDLDKFYGDRAAWDAYAGKGDADMTDEQAAQLAEVYHQVTRQDDPTGRNMLNNDHDHIKWIAAGLSELRGEVDEMRGTLAAIASAVGAVVDSANK